MKRTLKILKQRLKELVERLFPQALMRDATGSG